MKLRIFKQFLWITVGVILIDIAYYFFYLPTNLVTGGTMGIAIIVKDYLPFNTSIFLYIVDGVLLFIGLLLLGKDFFIRTVYATILSPTVVLICETFFDSDFFKLNEGQTPYLVSGLAGGLLTAIGLGLCFRNKGTTGGMDVVQKILSKYLHIPYSYTMYMTDVVVIAIGGFFVSKALPYDIEMVIYGTLTVIGIGYVVDKIALNARNRRTAYIITQKYDEMRQMIYDTVDRGITVTNVYGGYTGHEFKMIICTMDKREAYRLSELVSKVDKNAFTFITETKEVVGNYEGLSDFRRKRS